MPLKHLTIILAIFLTNAAAQPAAPLQYGGKTYKTVKIGEQTWMAENLNYEAEGSVCYDNDPKNCTKYGHLYYWLAAKKVCPKGWHLPTDAEWDKLYRFVDGDTGTESPYESSSAGKHLKAKSGWNSYEKSYDNGTDAHGFSALPGGGRGWGGSFNYIGTVGFWWSANKYDDGIANLRLMDKHEGAYPDEDNMNNMLSVRCLQD